MKNNRRTIGIDEKIYTRFKIICDTNNFKINKHAEKVLLEYIEKIEKIIGKSNK